MTPSACCPRAEPGYRSSGARELGGRLAARNRTAVTTAMPMASTNHPAAIGPLLMTAAKKNATVTSAEMAQEASTSATIGPQPAPVAPARWRSMAASASDRGMGAPASRADRVAAS